MKSRPGPSLWVIEMYDYNQNKWKPLISATHTKPEAQNLLKWWAKDHPGEWFRVSRYRFESGLGGAYERKR